MEDKIKFPNEKINTLIENFCNIILTKADSIDINKTINYIKGLTFQEIEILKAYSNFENYEKYIIPIVQQHTLLYLASYGLEEVRVTPFSFDSGNFFQKYQEDFFNFYKSFHKQKAPTIFNFIFDYIKDISTTYVFFEKFIIINNIKNKKSYEALLKKYTEEFSVSAEKITDIEAKKAAKAAKKEFVAFAKEINDEAKKEAVNKVKVEVMSKVSETNVTILGIFAAIVLTVVAGLFYSSSVIGNIVCADPCKLIGIGSLVGVVCIDLISFLFYFIEKIKEPSLSFNLKGTIVILNIVLLSFVLLFGIFSFVHDEAKFSSDNSNDSELSSISSETCETTFEEKNNIFYTCQ